MKIVFMGTPDFAVYSLKSILAAGFEVVGVVTAPDKPAGRGQMLNMSPVKKVALENNLKILQPDKLRDPVFLNALKSLKADLFVVVAFRMLPEIVWNMPRKGTINLHGSLLPQYRGAAPINWAIINGETETGLTVFFIEKEIDTGMVIKSMKVPIPIEFSAGNLHDILAPLGAELLIESMKYINGFNSKVEVIAQSQNEMIDDTEFELKNAPKIKTEDCKIDWNETGNEIYNFIRGMSPSPCAYTFLEGKKFKIYFASIEEVGSTENFSPGTLKIINGKMHIMSSDKWVIPEEVQLEGRKKMKTIEFIRGYQIKNEIYLP